MSCKHKSELNNDCGCEKVKGEQCVDGECQCQTLEMEGYNEKNLNGTTTRQRQLNQKQIKKEKQNGS